eukprot:CAMPEP_0119034646 /NCGR_PEP_ID=MMETSP1177-20130426/1648_1 /TAXON_ID=2985 /ORGANISM="Ochromonas sp, Strain CCMP1899" /LENGTH=211 /DNA_ID=CAMNT_0006992231 /DNA_START=164 /DNA_END=796 /DNA_ORIENTATION=+
MTQGKKTTMGSARGLLFNCKAQATKSVWYKNGLLGSEFRSQHTVLMTHVWMVHKRLVAEGAIGRQTQECMFDELWEDTCSRLRAEGINELSINKYLSEVQSYSFKYCIELDEAISKNSEEEVLDEIGGSLWRHAYVRSDDIEIAHVMKFADYVWQEQQSLFHGVSTEALMDGRIKWGPTPIWDEPSKVLHNSEHEKERLVSGGNESDGGDW